MLGAVAHYLKVGSPQWAVRRRCAIGGLLFCGGYAIDAAHWVEDTAKAQTMINTAGTMATLIFTAYVFAVVWDDKSRRTDGGGGAE